ncbi:NAD(P)-binding protein [Acephala macrosclerotiorum]|nr:NAD(P)-binding protein [Acephala macrosclerotiorum]
MSAFKKVAVIRASRNLGVFVIAALLESGFDVTAITRRELTAAFTAAVTVTRTDFKSFDALIGAFHGQDAVISTVATVATGSEKIIIDAAIAAKVKRYIASEFGLDTREARGTKIGSILGAKAETVDYLIQFSKEHEWFTWTAFSTGSFSDWSIKVGIFGIDFKNKTAKIYDSGKEPCSPTTLPFIGKCIAAYLTTASFTVTQREVLKTFEEEMNTKFQIINVTSSDLEKVGDGKLARGDDTAFVEFVLQWMFADGSNHAIKDNAAKLLGLEEEDLRTVAKRVVGDL